LGIKKLLTRQPISHFRVGASVARATLVSMFLRAANPVM
jgi:hypothetical protein